MASEFKSRLQTWGNSLKAAVMGKAPKLDEFKVGIKNKNRVPERIRITFPRHYIFREKGVGRGRKAGSGKETPKPDINTALDAKLPELADIAAEEMIDIAVRNFMIK